MIYSESMKKFLKRSVCYLWYLSEEFVDYDIFSNRISDPDFKKYQWHDLLLKEIIYECYETNKSPFKDRPDPWLGPFNI